MGSVIPVSRADDGKLTQSVDVGMAIHDAMVNEPYFYVNHWTRVGTPDYENLPELPGKAFWHIDGCKGAILPIRDAVGNEEPGEQGIRLYFKTAVEASISLLRA